MKNKDSMDKLRFRIIRNFLIILLVETALQSLLDLFMDLLEANVMESLFASGSGKWVASIILAYFALSILIFWGSGYLFYRMTKKLLKKESERRIKEQNLLYSAIAHDLKTPMTSVQGFAKALNEGRISPDEQAEICELIYQKTKSMNELVDTLFEYSKFGTDEYTLHKSDIDIPVLVRDLIAENYSDFESHNIHLDIDIPEKNIMINGDKKELKRAFSNLIINSYKHNPEGTEVKISVAEKNGTCEIIIADNGEEIPPEMDIFSPFVTSNTTRQTNRGTGLGLAITKRIIEKHEGTIALENNLKGCTKGFVIRLMTAMMA